MTLFAEGCGSMSQLHWKFSVIGLAVARGMGGPYVDNMSARMINSF